MGIFQAKEMDIEKRRFLIQMFSQHYGDPEKRNRINALINEKDNNSFEEKLERIRTITKLPITSRNVIFFPSYGFNVLLSNKSFDNIKNITELHVQISCIDKIYTSYVSSTFYEKLTIKDKPKTIVHYSTIFLDSPKEYSTQFDQINQIIESEWNDYSFFNMKDLLFPVSIEPKLTYIHSNTMLFYHAFFTKLRTDLIKIVR